MSDGPVGALGNPSGVQRAGTALADVADSMDEVRTSYARLEASVISWQGDASKAYDATSAGMMVQLDGLRNSVRQCAEVLARLGNDLEGEMNRLEGLLARAGALSFVVGASGEVQPQIAGLPQVTAAASELTSSINSVLEDASQAQAAARAAISQLVSELASPATGGQSLFEKLNEMVRGASMVLLLPSFVDTSKRMLPAVEKFSTDRMSRAGRTLRTGLTAEDRSSGARSMSRWRDARQSSNDWKGVLDDHPSVGVLEKVGKFGGPVFIVAGGALAGWSEWNSMARAPTTARASDAVIVGGAQIAGSVAGAVVGEAAGGALGAVIGSVIPIVGTVAGVWLGGFIGLTVGGIIGGDVGQFGGQILAGRFGSDVGQGVKDVGHAISEISNWF